MPTNRVSFAVIGDHGVVLRTGVCDEVVVLDQADPGQLLISPIPDEVSDTTHYYDGESFVEYPAKPDGRAYWNGSGWISIPEQPNEYSVWNGTTWVDPRSQAEYDGALHHSRMHTEIPTGLAIHKLAEIGAYPMAEIANDAVGIPATIREFIDLPEFPQFERDLMLAYFKTMPTVPRSMTRVFGPIHPDDPGDGYPSFIPWLATAKSITISPEQLDILWGVDVPPPLHTAP